MFDIKVKLIEAEVQFDPPIGTTHRNNGIQDIIMKICNDFISISIMIPRLDTNGTGDYLVEIKDQFDIFDSTQVISTHLQDIQDATRNFISQYDEYSFLWKEDLEESFEAFLNTGLDPREQSHKRINEDGEEEEDETFKWMAEKILDGV